MKAFWGTLAILLALTKPILALPSSEDVRPPVAIAVDSITLDNLSSDSLRFLVQSHVTSTRTLHVNRVRFEQMRLGSLPVYMNPLEEKLALTAGNPVALPPIPVTVYLRDLDSMEPLEQAVKDGQAAIAGYARIDLDLNLLERFASNQWNAHADMPIKVTVAVDIPGGFLGRAAALATLQAAQIALSLRASGLNPLRQSQSGQDELRSVYAPSLVVAESRYAIMRNQQRVEIVVRQLGFRISADSFVLTGEMLEPWKYDLDVATALQKREVSLIDGSPELLVWPAGMPLENVTARSLAQGAIQVVHSSGKMESTEVPNADNHLKVRLYRRDSNNNYAVLRFTHAEDQGAALPPLMQPEADDERNRVSIFRVDDRGQMDVTSTPAHHDGSRIILDEPLDNSAFGSILIGREGAIGMLQDEHSGMTLRSNWQ